MRGNKKLTRRIHTRITQAKHEELCALLARSHSIGTLSELLRNILDHKPITVQNHDVSIDKMMEQLSAIRKELQSIGVNINQVTQRFHVNEFPSGKLLQAMEIARLYQQTDLKVTELFIMMAKLSELWLPKS